MAEWTVDSKGVKAIYVEGAVVEHETGLEGSRIKVTVPNRRSDWRESRKRDLFMLRSEGRSTGGHGNVTNVISGGVQTGPVIQAGNVRGPIHIGPNGISGLPDQSPLKVKIVTPPGIDMDYES